MSRRAARLGLLALLVTCPGCITSSLWGWADGPSFEAAAEAEEVLDWRRVDGGELEVRVRWSDGRTTRERLGLDHPGSPAHLMARAREGAARDPAAAAADVRLAVRRGWPDRGLARDPALAPAAAEPQLLEADAAPVVSPTFVVRRLGEVRDGRAAAELLLVDQDGDTAFMAHLAPELERDGEGEAGRKVVAVLLSPVTVCLDVATAPIQGLVFAYFLAVLGEALGGT